MPAAARAESICGQTQHTPWHSCQATSQGPIKPTSKRTTGTLGRQIFSHSNAGCALQATGRLTPELPSKCRAQLPSAHKGHFI